MIRTFGRLVSNSARIARQASIAAAAAVLFAGGLAATGARAETAPTLIGTFNDWSAYSITENGKTVCFAVSEPKAEKLSNPNARRGDPFFMVTRWADGQPAQPSVLIGYPQASGSRTKISIGSDEFEMFVEGDGAWMETEVLDAKLIESMKKGSKMVVTGRSGRGTVTTDTYSLSGISAALDKIQSGCQ